MPAQEPKVAARKVALTDRSLQALKPAPAGRRIVVWDALMPGLAVRVTDKGKRSFYAVRRRAGQSQPTWALLGSYPLTTLAEARAAAREALGTLIKGEDPATLAAAKRRSQDEAARQRAASTFGAVAEEFIHRYEARGLRRGAEVAALIRREFVSLWSDRPIGDIAHRDVLDTIEAIIDRGSNLPAGKRRSGGRHAARHAFAACRLLFGWAFRRELVPINPTARINAKELHGLEQSALQRDRVLTDDELRVVWAAAERTPYPFGPLVKLLLLTGARRSEIAEASWAEIDLEAKTLTVPTTRMKMKAAHVIPLTPAALAIVEALPRFAGGDYMFTTMAGRRPISGFSKYCAKFDATVGGSIAFTLHDLRRTCRTGLAAVGVSPFIGELVIGHAQKGVHAVYDLFRYHAEKRDALERWAARLLATVAPQPEPAPGGNVVSLPARARA